MLDKSLLRAACKASYRDQCQNRERGRQQRQAARNQKPDAGGPKPEIRFWIVIKLTTHDGVKVHELELERFRSEKEAKIFEAYQQDHDFFMHILRKGYTHVVVTHRIVPIVDSGRVAHVS